MIEIRDIENSIRKEATTVLFRVVLFLIYYIALILLGIGLFAGAFWVTWQLLTHMSIFERINVRAVVWGGLVFFAMWWFCIQFAWYLVKPLFSVNKVKDDGLREVSEKECPKLFAIIEEISKQTGNKMPKHVYLKPEQNASVFYNSTSIWSIFFPTRKNLMVGTMLLQGMSKDELSAVLAHEFGHFSQHTMKVGSVTYRLLLIIRDMIKLANEAEEDARQSRSSDNTWNWMFHLARIPMSHITRLTIKFYNYIEKKNRSLSRYMEFEADSVACRIVGAKPFVSSLCKLEVLSSRFGIFENVMAKLLSEKRYIAAYQKGYELVDKLIADDERLPIAFDSSLETLVGDDWKFPTKVKIIDGWNTHPSTMERIENATQFMQEGASHRAEDARELVSEAIQSELGIMRQQQICKDFETPVSWNEVTEMPMEEFEKWIKNLFDKKRIPNFVLPFVQKNTVHFDYPSDEQMAMPIDTPFTHENRDLLLEYRTGLNDMQTLTNLSEEKVSEVMYDGETYTDINKAIEKHQEYIDTFEERLVKLEEKMFIYLCQHSSRGDLVPVAYWMTYYAVDALSEMNELLNHANYVHQQAQQLQQQGRGFTLVTEYKNHMADLLLDFLRNFEYDKVREIAGTWSFRDKTVGNYLDEWQACATNGNKDSIGTDRLLDTIDCIYNFLILLHKSGKNTLGEMIEEVGKV